MKVKTFCDVVYLNVIWVKLKQKGQGVCQCTVTCKATFDALYGDLTSREATSVFRTNKEYYTGWVKLL